MLKYIFIFLFVSVNLHAQEESVYSEAARLRQYAGGADEADLVVQKNLNVMLFCPIKHLETTYCLKVQYPQSFHLC